MDKAKEKLIKSYLNYCIEKAKEEGCSRPFIRQFKNLKGEDNDEILSKLSEMNYSLHLPEIREEVEYSESSSSESEEDEKKLEIKFTKNDITTNSSDTNIIRIVECLAKLYPRVPQHEVEMTLRNLIEYYEEIEESDAKDFESYYAKKMNHLIVIYNDNKSKNKKFEWQDKEL